MTYKVASKKAQARARRVMPEHLGDVGFQEKPFTPEERRELLLREKNKINDRLGVLPKTEDTFKERSALGRRICEINPELGKLKKEINAANASKQSDLQGYIIAVSREIIQKQIGPEAWDKVLADAKERARTLGFRAATHVRGRPYGG